MNTVDLRERIAVSNHFTAEQRMFLLELLHADLGPRDALKLLLDQVDYTRGYCRPNEMIGALVSAEVMRLCRKALDQ